MKYRHITVDRTIISSFVGDDAYHYSLVVSKKENTLSKYKCHICGKEHEFYENLSIPISNQLKELIDTNSARLVPIEDMYFFDKKQFVCKGLMEISTEFNFIFNIDLWIAIDALEMYSKKEDVDNSSPITVSGEIVSDLRPLYEYDYPIEIDAMFSNWSYNNKTVEFIVTNHKELMMDQKNGYTREKLISQMTKIYHPIN